MDPKFSPANHGCQPESLKQLGQNNPTTRHRPPQLSPGAASWTSTGAASISNSKAVCRTYAFRTRPVWFEAWGPKATRVPGFRIYGPLTDSVVSGFGVRDLFLWLRI